MRIRALLSLAALATVALAPTSNAYLLIASEDFSDVTAQPTYQYSALVDANSRLSSLADAEMGAAANTSTPGLTFRKTGGINANLTVVSDSVISGNSALSWNGATNTANIANNTALRTGLVAVLPQTVKLNTSLSVNGVSELVNKLTVECDFRAVGTVNSVGLSNNPPLATAPSNQVLYPLGFFRVDKGVGTATDPSAVTGDPMRSPSETTNTNFGSYDDWGYAMKASVGGNDAGFTWGGGKTGNGATGNNNVGPQFSNYNAQYGNGFDIAGDYQPNNVTGDFPAAFDTPFALTNAKTHMIFELQYLPVDTDNGHPYGGVRLTSIISAVDSITGLPIDLNPADPDHNWVVNTVDDWNALNTTNTGHYVKANAAVSPGAPFDTFEVISLATNMQGQFIYDNFNVYANWDAPTEPLGDVPEPATLGLLGLGSLLMARRNRKAA